MRLLLSVLNKNRNISRKTIDFIEVLCYNMEWMAITRSKLLYFLSSDSKI